MGTEMSIDQRLHQLGIVLPEPPTPLGAYVPAVRSGNLLFLSGMLPLRSGKPAYTGRIGDQLSLAEARAAAQLAVLNGLSVARSALGTLDAVRNVVRLALFQRTTNEFQDHASVAD